MLSAAHVKTSSTTTPRASSEPPPSSDSRSSRDGWLPKARSPPAGTGSFPACVPARPPGQTVQDGTQARTAALEWATQRIAKQARATLGDELWADFVAHANACDKDAFLSAFRKPILRCRPAPPARRCVPAQLQHRRDMRESVRDARRAAPRPRAGLGRDVRHVACGCRHSRRSHARPRTWDDGVDGTLLCHLLFSVHDDPAEGAAMLRFR
jgi:hypothetical protein